MPRSKDITPPPVSTAQVLRRFRVVFNTVRGHFQQVEKQAGVGGAQVWALSVIRDQPGIGMGGLAKSMDIHQSTASNLVKALQKKDMLSMTKAVVDRRNVELKILPAGLAVLAKVTGPFEGILPEALGQLPLETLTRMDGDLLELIRLLKADEKAGGIPLGQL
jgi:DNA-binding MarR family transcriptional regulator